MVGAWGAAWHPCDRQRDLWLPASTAAGGRGAACSAVARVCRAAAWPRGDQRVDRRVDRHAALGAPVHAQVGAQGGLAVQGARRGEERLGEHGVHLLGGELLPEFPPLLLHRVESRLGVCESCGHPCLVHGLFGL